MTVTLPPHLEALIHEKVASGDYPAATGVVEHALRLLDERDRLVRLRATIAVGDAQIARGEVIEWAPDFMEPLNQEADEEDRLGVPLSEDALPSSVLLKS